MALAAVAWTAIFSLCPGNGTRAHPLCPAGSGTPADARICIVLDLRGPGPPRDLTAVLKETDRLPDGAGEADFLLVGEVHDNPEHHKVQAAYLPALQVPVTEQHARALVVEHVRADQQETVDKFQGAWPGRKDGGRDIAPLFSALAWDTSGWPDQTMFAPVFQNALDFGYRIIAGEPPRDRVRSISRGGLPTLDAVEARHLGLDVPLAPKLQEALLDELEESHCGLMPRSAFGGMAVAQRYRDAYMADTLVKAAQRGNGVVLFAGNGHVRTDRGVPLYLRQMAPGRSILTVMQVEIEDDKSEALAYIPRGTEGKPVADYLFITTRAERTDPCVEMKARFGKK